MKIYNLSHNIDFEKVNNNLAYGISNLNEFLKIHFNTKIFCTPSGITMLSSLTNYKKELLTFTYENIQYIRYLLRNDFFKNLNIDINEDFQRHDATANMLECSMIKGEDDPYIIELKLKKILNNHIKGKENLVLGILLTTNEITDNILEHSSGNEFVISGREVEYPGFVSAQYYTRENSVEIGISDMGMGIVDTMSSEVDYLSLDRESILRKAFELNTSRHKKLMPTRGNGLAKLKEFVLISNGSIRCRTNEFVIIFSSEYPDGIINKVNSIPGTHFEIKIGCSKNIDTKPIFNAEADDYDDNLDDFFD